MERAALIAIDEALERAFEQKRKNFLDDYELNSKPALILQAWPVEPLSLDISNEKLREAMRQGGGSASEDGWWYGFKFGWWPALVFDGLSSKSEHGSAGWATEVHVDGHIAAGVWTFQEANEGTAAPQMGVGDFYSNVFLDFTYLVSEVLGALGVSGAVQVTATVHLAEKLALFGGYGRISAPAPNRRTLRWPIATTTVADLPGAGSAMAAQFMRTYGRKARQ